jgi:hypothetical protein
MKLEFSTISPKVAFVASIATILGFVVTFTSSGKETVKQIINGEKNTVIGENTGEITINYGASPSNTQTMVLRNERFGSALVLSEPSLDDIQNPKKQVCTASSNTPISLTGRKTKQGYLEWKEVTIMEGECKGKTGWASSNVIGYR